MIRVKNLIIYFREKLVKYFKKESSRLIDVFKNYVIKLYWNWEIE